MCIALFFTPVPQIFVCTGMPGITGMGTAEARGKLYNAINVLGTQIVFMPITPAFLGDGGSYQYLCVFSELMGLLISPNHSVLLHTYILHLTFS